MSYECRGSNRPLTSSLGFLYQNEVKCSAFDVEMIFHSHANKTHFHHFESDGFWNSEVAYLHDKICREVMTYASRAR